MLAVSRGIDFFTEILGNIALWIVTATVLVGAWNTFGRFFGRFIGTNLTSNLFIELQWYLFSLTYFLAAGYVLKHNGHVRVDVLYDGFSPKRKAWINLLGTTFLLFPFCALITFFAWGWLMQSWRILEGSPDPSGLPRYPIKTMVVVGMAFLAMQGVSEWIKSLAIITGHLEPPKEVKVVEEVAAAIVVPDTVQDVLAKADTPSSTDASPNGNGDGANAVPETNGNRSAPHASDTAPVTSTEAVSAGTKEDN